MSSPIIRVENLGKCYRIHHEARERYTALRDVIARKAKRLLHPASRNQHPASSEEDFWALKDVSFEVNQGEVVGIIGRNGAGKSTLLKILSRITEPTTGRITLNGRVASLLEVGTGFHPELTGRENIYLNGAILGMTKAEIKSKFDEIVAFAEVERFLDTPVKRYSSGMYVRLAFAVAAHLEPEILVVDEVLAVGDAEFQKKCLGKMGEVAKGGRTVLFVSHNMAAVGNLCSAGIVLDRGRLLYRGIVQEAIFKYANEGARLANHDLQERRERSGSGTVRFTRVSFHSMDGIEEQAQSLHCGQDAVMRLHMRKERGAESLRNLHLAVGVDNSLNQRVIVWATNYCGQDFERVDDELFSISLRVPRLPLLPGRFSFTLFSSVDGEISDWVINAGSFDVEAGDYYGTGRLPSAGEAMIVTPHSFHIDSRLNVPSL